MAEHKKKEWVDLRHEGYDDGVAKRKYARDQYTGSVFDITQAEASSIASEEKVVAQSKIENVAGVRILRIGGKATAESTYLKRRTQGESAQAFFERAQITRFPNHMAALVDSYVGGVMSVDSKADRDWENDLGDPAKEDSVMFRLARDIDGTGLNWVNANTRAAQDLIVDDIHAEYIDKVLEDDPSRVWRIDPDRILNIRRENGVVVELLLDATKMEQGSLKQEAVEVVYYILYSVDGWEKYREDVDKTSKERKIVLVDSGAWRSPFWTTPDMTQKRLPFTLVNLGIGRDVGYQMAVDHNQLYNLLSDARWNFRVINHPRLTGDVDDEQFLNSIHSILEGMNAMQGKWSYISPDSANGEVAYKTYESETQQFYITNHQRMNGTSIERSATEIMFNEAAGRTAFLTILSGALDELENDRLFLLSQIEAPGDPSSWYKARVKRTTDFRPVDMLTTIQSQSISFSALVTAGVELGTAALISTKGFTEDLIAKVASQPEPEPVIEVLPAQEPNEDNINNQ